MTSPFEATSLYPQAVFIPTSIHRRDMMREQLITLGVPAENILISDDIFQDEKLRLQNSALTAKDKLTFGVDIARHCNLNCKNCTYFSPLVKGKEFLEIDSYRYDLERLAKLFGDKVNIIWLIGGEPLLNPDINSFLRITHDFFPTATLTIITNGTLIPKMPASFWECVRDCKVTFNVSAYPIGLDYSKVLETIRQNGGIVNPIISSAESGKFYWWPFDFSGSQDPKESFCNCIQANMCTTLREGKIYACPTVGFIDTFNEYFGTKMFPTEDDYIDIYKAQSAEEILKFLAKPVPFCRYCDVSHRHDIPWGRSKKEITEWS